MAQVLLVDDNPVQLKVRELVLRKAEIETHVATNAPSTLALLRSDVGRQKIGAVVTDHVMPKMDGVEFVKQLRAFNPDLPVIVISGMPDADQEYSDLNVIFRLKPCDPDELITLVKSVLKRSDQRASA